MDEPGNDDNAMQPLRRTDSDNGGDGGLGSAATGVAAAGVIQESDVGGGNINAPLPPDQRRDRALVQDLGVAMGGAHIASSSSSSMPPGRNGGSSRSNNNNSSSNSIQEMAAMHASASSSSLSSPSAGIRAANHQAHLRRSAMSPPVIVSGTVHRVGDIRSNANAPAGDVALVAANPTGSATSQSTMRSASGGTDAGGSRLLNPYYSAAAARASESILESIDNNPETGPPHTLMSSSGWSSVPTDSGAAGGVPPCERSLHSAAVLNGTMYVFGGYNGQARVNDFHAFSYASRRWSPVLPSANSGRPPSPRDRHSSVVYGTSFYVFGGFDGTSRTNDFFGFDLSSMTWREVVPRSGRPPSERHSHAAVVHANSMYVFGGYDGSYKSDVHQFDFTMSKWSAVATGGRRPTPRYRATCVVHRNYMILFGGHNGTRHLADTHIFDFETRSWASLTIEGTPPIPRDSHVSVVWNGSMYVFGGSSGSAMNDLHELQIPSATNLPAKWRQVKFTGDQPCHRFCHVGVVYQDAMFVFGGYDGSERLNEFIRFDFAAYDLSFEVPSSTLIADLRQMVNDDTLSDITFIVEDQPVYAHKLMLMRSSYFQALFLGDMRESRLSKVHIEQVRYPIFLAVLEYLYTDQVRIPFESAMELFEAADLFAIPRLMTMCEKRMLESITVENAATIFHAADMHTATTLRRKSLKYILSHFEEVSKTKSFYEMGKSSMELVFEVLRNR